MTARDQARGSSSLRVAFFLGEFARLSETFIRTQIVGLRDRGHDVDVHADRHEQAAPPDLGDRITLRYRPRLPSTRVGRLLGTARPLAALVPHPLVALRCALRAFRPEPLRTLYAAAGAAGAERPDIVHAHFGPVGLRALRVREVGLLPGPLVVSFYGYDLTSFLRARGPHVYAPLFARADRLVALSEVMRGRLIDLGAPKERVSVVPLGVDTRALARRDPPSPCGRLRILSVSRLIDKKGLDDGLSAVARLADPIRRRVVWRVIGDGPLRCDLEREIVRLGLSEQVELLGARPPEVVRGELGRAHVLLAPSRVADDGDEEGTPTAIIEAMAAGLVVVSTFHAGIPELVEDGVSGLLAPERNAEALADRLGEALAHPERWPAWSEAARARAVDHHDRSVVCAQLEALYTELCRS